MKKIIISLFVILVWQHSNAQTFHWKPTLGINADIQNLTDSISSGNNAVKPGFDIGLLVEIHLKKNLSLETGCLFSQNKSSLQRTFIYPFVFYTDAPQVKENFTLNMLKVPVVFLLKENKKNPWVFGLGPVVKVGLNSQRSGYSSNYRDQKYSDHFVIKTKSGGSIGLGVQSEIKKEFLISKQKFSAGLYYDNDISRWGYPTHFDLEKHYYYSLTNHNFSFLISYCL